ncbi:hypothetical protein ALQ76_200036 [Pseudomonas syringae pv. atrofaciens]|nr:hypothetical protein ALQ76_200036 [Pseudomonas syringae pv. atrofaciens]
MSRLTGLDLLIYKGQRSESQRGRVSRIEITDACLRRTGPSHSGLSSPLTRHFIAFYRGTFDTFIS